jgi:hypothetical protein
MNTYKTTHKSNCPNGGLSDCYKITIKSPQTIMVEDIIQTLKECPDPIYQESLADRLRAKIGAYVKVSGWHHGVKIISVRE